MALLLGWVRHDVRSRRRSLLVLALLIAVASGTVMTAVVGAKRGASAVDRLQAETLPATVLVAPYRPDSTGMLSVAFRKSRLSASSP